jgi:hypothetical protein
MLPEGINAIVRAGGVEAAALAQPWADDSLVAFNQQDYQLGQRVFHGMV